MSVHRFTPTRYHHTFGTHDGVLTLAPGDVLHTSTVDASGRDARDEAVTERGNPLTGPFVVEGAEPGDTLVVRIRSLRQMGLERLVVPVLPMLGCIGVVCVLEKRFLPQA